MTTWQKVRCPDCGRFARYDAYYANWRCDGCDRIVHAPPRVPPPPVVSQEQAKADLLELGRLEWERQQLMRNFNMLVTGVS